MKIAICIYGVHTDYKCVEFVEKMSKKFNTTVFVHSWDYSKSWYPKKLPFNKQKFDGNNIDLHIHSTLYENVIKELKSKQHFFANQEQNTFPDIGFISLLYGMNQVNKLKNKIQATNKKPFDCVFCMTFNTYIDKSIDINAFDMKVLNATYHCESPVNPNFVFSSSENISKYCSLYQHLHELNPKLNQDNWMNTYMKHMRFNRFWLQSDVTDNQ